MDPQSTLTETDNIKHQNQNSINFSFAENAIISESEFDKDFFLTKKMSADSVINDDGNIEINTTINEQEERTEPVANTEAKATVKMLIDFRENIQSYIISYISDGNLNESEKYTYQPSQKNKLIEAWTPIIEKYKIRFSPWWNVIISEAICTGPLIALAAKNREYRLEIEKLRNKIKNENSIEINTNNTRSDTKTAWKVDTNGYYEYSPQRVYIKKEDRTERPVINEETYELLCRHNGKEYIDNIFKIK